VTAGAPRPRRLTLAAIAIAAVPLGGCGSLSDSAQVNSLRALEQPIAKPATLSPPGPRPRCRGEFDSPAASRLPPAGHMPPGTLMARIHRAGRLRVGVDQNTLRLGYFNPRITPPSEAMQGLDIDLAGAVARAIFGRSWKQHIVYTAISTAQRESAVTSGAVDLVASAFSINCKRKQTMYFSQVYYRAQQKLLVPVDATVDSLADLRGQRVCATVGSTSIDNLYATGVVRHPVALRPDCLVELQEGRVAAISADDSILIGFREQDPQTKIVGGCINIERYGIAINRRHREFVRFVNGVLERLGADGLERIRHRWLPDLRAPTRGQIARCDRRPMRQRAAVAAALLDEEHRVMRLRGRWLRGLAAPVSAGLFHCDRDCQREAAR
jgi:polar amino acid transport system substrate-binding protein